MLFIFQNHCPISKLLFGLIFKYGTAVLREKEWANKVHFAPLKFPSPALKKPHLRKIDL